jgi:hypothetical protein
MERLAFAFIAYPSDDAKRQQDGNKKIRRREHKAKDELGRMKDEYFARMFCVTFHNSSFCRRPSPERREYDDEYHSNGHYHPFGAR